MDLSIIVPLFNEEANVCLLYQAIKEHVDRLGLDYEILFVDDGSHDDTFSAASQLASDDRHLKIIRFRKNYGQTPAMVAGMDYAQGEILVTMDGDLQNDPADISKLIAKIDEGYDIVVGWRHRRKDNVVTRKIPSVIANWIISKVTGVPIKDNGCSLKAYRADVIRNVPLYSEMHRFIPAMTSVIGARIAEVKVSHHARKYGVSKYGLSRTYKVLLDLITIKTLVSFTRRPALWFAIMALPFMLMSFIFLGASVYSLLESPATVPLPIAGASLLFSASVVFLLLSGALGELIYKMGDIDLDRLSLQTAVCD